MTARRGENTVLGVDRRPVKFRVVGAAGRVVGHYGAHELAEWKHRIRQLVGQAQLDPAPAAHEDTRIPVERFEIVALGEDGLPVGEPEIWSGE